MKKIFLSAAVVLLLGMVVMNNGCTNHPTTTEITKTNGADTAWLADALFYVGHLPSDDSGEVRAIIFISADYTRFKLTTKSNDENGVEHVTVGHLNTERGFENDEDATVYILNDDKPAKEQYIFVRKTGSENIYPCNSNRKIITGYVLNRVQV